MDDKTRIFDLHCDTLDRLGWPLLDEDLKGVQKAYVDEDSDMVEPGVLIDFASGHGHLSLDRTAAFDWCQCLAIYVPDPYTPAQSARFFETIVATLPRHIVAHPDMLAQVRDARDIESVLARGCTAGLLTIENGKLLAAAPDMVERIAVSGVKMVTLTWNAENPLGSGNETTHGLSAFGREMIAALEARRIVVDVSHLNDAGFADLLGCAKRPFAASHSNSRAICPHPRNLTDDQFRALRDAGGIAGINYCRRFLSDEHDDPTREDLLAHIEHWLDLDGSDAIALGSDYDGCDVPSWLAPCDRMGELAELLRTHFGPELAEKILFSNAHEFFMRNETL